MTSPLIPATLFVSFFVAFSAALPLAQSSPALALLCVAVCAMTFVAIVYWTLRADAAADPHRRLTRTLERFDERWPNFERDFWAHVAQREAAPERD